MSSWLIEFRSGGYLGLINGCKYMKVPAASAVRFQREEDAIAVIEIFRLLSLDMDLVATEHMFG